MEDPIEKGNTSLRLVPAAELYEHFKAENATPEESVNGGPGVEYEVVNAEGKVVMRTNQHIVDNAASQRLSNEEIEALKQGETSSGRNIIAKILESHSALDKKTSYALAKYTLRKTRKFMRRFTVLPLDVPLLTSWMVNEKDGGRIMDIREEMLAQICSWANVYCDDTLSLEQNPGNAPLSNSNRWLVIDETGGLIIAAMAERMGILYPQMSGTGKRKFPNGTESRTIGNSQKSDEVSRELAIPHEQILQTNALNQSSMSIIAQESAMSATTNSITLIHPNPQPNLSLLTYFGYEAGNPDARHPLHTNLRTLSWLQLLHPEEDSAYQEPEGIPEQELAIMKSSKKGTYYRKRRRWQRTKSIVDDTRAGNFAGLIVASVMAPATVLHHVVPLLQGGTQVVVYSPTIEPLTKLVDCYSKLRRTAYQNAENPQVPSGEFPVNPLLLLAPTIYTARTRPWQVLPGRTHPKMTARGGAEGYVFVATRVLPLEAKVDPRGTYQKRKADISNSAQTPSGEAMDLDDG